MRPKLALASKWAPYTLEQYRSFSELWPVKIRREAKRSPPPYTRLTAGESPIVLLRRRQR
jgi:hypothetical protein